MQWRKLYDRDTDRARLTDKAHGKRIAKAALGARFVVPTLWEGTVLPRVAPWPLPFVVKANHGCRQTRIIHELADYRQARRAARGWLNRAYGGWLNEWHYGSARRSIMVEPYVGSGTTLPIDYKIYVFSGRAAMIQVHEERGGSHRWSHHDRDWRRLSRTETTLTSPSSLSAMLDAAETLGTGHDFLRVDFYEVDGAPLFGEFCLYPGSGLDRFDPVAIDHWLGSLWRADQMPNCSGSAGLSRAVAPQSRRHQR